MTRDLLLTCEYCESPIGVENPRPRFAWRGTGALACARQRAYRVRVWRGEDIAWDSGEVASARSFAVAYAGVPLVSAAVYTWQVCIWPEDDAAPVESEIATFETGLLAPEDWAGACWIGAPVPVRGVAPMLRRAFTLDNAPEHARLYLCGLGYADVRINGQRPDESRLDPGWTDTRKTALYRAWDVTPLLRAGENVLAVELGEGWHGNEHDGAMALIGGLPSWLGYPKMICRLAVDGMDIVSGTDGAWLVSEGPIRANNIYDGVLYDARLEKPGWDVPGYACDPKEWKPATESAPPGGILRCQLMPPIQEMETIEPVHIAFPDDAGPGAVTVDLGVNIAGWVRIEARGAVGQTIRLRYAESVDERHEIDQRNLRGAKAMDTYIFGADGKAAFAPRFTYHGFRYVRIDADPGVVITRVVGVRAYSAVARASLFTCANPLVNRIYSAVIRTEGNNLHSLPTDCPQRDERLAWLNDMAVRCEQALYNFNMMPLYEKWLRDIADAQRDDGAIPDTAPFYFGGMPASHISSVYVLLPWLLYLFYGDDQPLREHYDGMRRYTEFMLAQRGADGLMDVRYFGEWSAPMTQCELGWGENAVPRNIDRQFVTTGYLYYDCLLMEKVAALLGHKEDSTRYHAEQAVIRRDLNAAFFREEGYYDKNAQGANAFALFLDICPEGREADVLAHLLQDIDARGGGITTGNQMNKYLFDALDRHGCADTAYRIASRTEYPSIGYMLEQGATTIWERWEYMRGNHMNSHDHPMLGAFSAWFFKGLCGLRPAEYAKDARIKIEPQIPAELCSASGRMQTPYGPVALAWVKVEGTLKIDAEVPWNLEAELVIGADSITLGPGFHTCSYPWPD